MSKMEVAHGTTTEEEREDCEECTADGNGTRTHKVLSAAVEHS